MEFKQKLSEADHRYIFKLFLRQRYPWYMHIIMSLIVCAAAIVPAQRYGLNSPQTGSILAIAAAYFLVTVFVVPWMLERKVMRQLKRSVSFGKELSYEADHYGICYTVAGGKTYQLYWNKLTSAYLTSRGVLFWFGRKTGIFIFSESFGSEKRWNEFLEVLSQENIHLISRKSL